MVVPLIALGTATKLAFAVAATYRTRWWWLAGGTAVAVGAAACAYGGAARPVGAIGIALGTIALVTARWLSAHAIVE